MGVSFLEDSMGVGVWQGRSTLLKVCDYNYVKSMGLLLEAGVQCTEQQGLIIAAIAMIHWPVAIY